jgi:sugar lactone lactonase YvrE
MIRTSRTPILLAALLVAAAAWVPSCLSADLPADDAGRLGPCRAGDLGDGGSAREAALCYPYGLAVARDGSVYIADRLNHRIRRVGSDGIITTVAGNGERGYAGDGGLAVDAKLNYPSDVAVGAEGTLYIADTYNQRVRKVDGAGVITTVAGRGWPPKYSGDGGPAAQAGLFYPVSVAWGEDGTLYIAGRGSHRIRKVSRAGVISTLAGTGESGYGGDGGPGPEATISWPFGIAADVQGNVYIADQNNKRVRKVDPEGLISTVAGSGEAGDGGDDGSALEASMRKPYDVAMGPDGSLYIADAGSQRIRKVDAAGTMTTVAGNGGRGFRGDGGPASEAGLDFPCGVAVAGDGTVYIADTANLRVRKVAPSGTITTVAGS